MPIVQEPITVSQELLEIEKFADGHFPPLKRKVQETRRAIYSEYKRAGKPLGPTLQSAMLWFDTEYRNYQRAQEESALQEAMATYETNRRELIQMGDLEIVDGKLKVTPKGVVRAIYFMSHFYVFAADQEERGLSPLDIIAVRHQLLLALAALEPEEAA